jgi:ABC-2 type transport system permease protein
MSPGLALTDALRAEWIKARTLASTGWLLLAAVVLTAAVSAAVASAVSCPAGGCVEDPAKISLTGVYLGQAVVAILAVLMISSEYAVLGGSHLARLLQQIGPMTAGLAIQATTGLRNLPISPWAGLGVLAAWAAGALLAGALLLRLRDA